MNKLAAIVSLLSVLSAAQAAWGQPLLDRVEQRLRQQAGGPAPAGAAGGVEPGYLGLVADDRRENGQGVRVTEVIANGPAALSGLQVNDLVVAIDRRPVRTMADMQKILQPQPAGRKLEFQITRSGGQQLIEVTLGMRPATKDPRFQNFGQQPTEQPPQQDPQLGGSGVVPPVAAPLVLTGPKLGVRTVPVTPQLAEQQQLGAAAGAYITAVSPGSAAERAGLPVGAIIVAVDGQIVRTPEDVAGHVKRAGYGGMIELTMLSGGQELVKKVALPGPPSVEDQAAGLPPQLGPADGPLVPSPQGGGPGPSNPDESYVQALERRVRQLEDRVQRLEAALQPSQR